MPILTTSLPQFFDDSGAPLTAGYVYVGPINQNPTVNPMELFWDEERTLPAAQPLRTTNGYISRNGTPATVYVSDSQYSLTVLDKNGRIVFTNRRVIASSTPVPSIVDFGASGDGITDSGPSIRAAIASLGAAGGMLYAPKGDFLILAAGGDASNTGFTIPSYVTLMGSGPVSTRLIPGANDTKCCRVIGLNGGLSRIGFNNSHGYTNCSAIRLAPTDESDTTTHSDIELNTFTDITIRNFAEALTLRPGPKVGSQDSYLYYNTFTSIDMRNNTRGIWLKDSPNGSAGANGNNFYAVRAGETGTNTGIQIDLGSENNFVGCALEGVESGTSPNTTPTGIIIATGTGASTANNSFVGLRIEGCTLDIELNSNITTNLINIANTGTINGTPGTYVGSQGIAYQGMPANNGARLVVNIPNNGEGVRFGDPLSSKANTFLSANISPGGGPTGYLEFLYSGQQVLTFGGVSSTYVGALRLNNPLNQPLLLGTQGADRVEIDGSGNMWPVSDNVISLGKSGQRWTAVWATNGTIQTSGRNQKRDISGIHDKILAAWSKVNYCQYKFKDAVDEKGDAARYHIGVIADEIEAAFISEGLDPFGYGIIYNFKNENGDDAYGVNYSEMLALECAYLRSLVKGKGK